MAEHGEHDTPASEDTSNASTPSTSGRRNLLGLRHGPRQDSKVKFSSLSAADDDDDDDAQGQLSQPKRRRSDVPEIRLSRSEDVADHSLRDFRWGGNADAAAAQAQVRASRLHNRLSQTAPRHHVGAKAPQSMTPQAFISPNSSPPTRPVSDWPVKLEDVPLQPIEKDKRPYTIHEDSTDEDESDVESLKARRPASDNYHEAKQLLRTMTGGHLDAVRRTEPRSGTETPAIDKRLHDLEYVPPPTDYRPSPFTLVQKLLTLKESGYTGPRLHEDPSSTAPSKHGSKAVHDGSHSRSGSESREFSATSSGRLTPKRPKWYDREEPNRQNIGSQETLLAAAAAPDASDQIARPAYGRATSSQKMIATAVDMIKHPTNYLHHKSKSSIAADEERVISDVAEIIACRKYLKKLARSLMAVGAPTHRLEEYMKTSARALNIDCDCLYTPGSMLVSINDRLTMSTEVTLVRESGGVDLGKFRDVFDVYKLVIHGKYTAEEGTRDLDETTRQRGRHPLGLRIFAYGIAAVSVGPFAFSARPVDFAPNFILGSTLRLPPARRRHKVRTIRSRVRSPCRRPHRLRFSRPGLHLPQRHPRLVFLGDCPEQHSTHSTRLYSTLRCLGAAEQEPCVRIGANVSTLFSKRLSQSWRK